MKEYMYISEFANIKRMWHDFNLRRWSQVHWKDWDYTPNIEAQRRILGLNVWTRDPEESESTTPPPSDSD